MPEAVPLPPIRERLEQARRPVRGWQSDWRVFYREDVARLLALVEEMGERMCAMSSHLSVLAERKEARGR